MTNKDIENILNPLDISSSLIGVDSVPKIFVGCNTKGKIIQQTIDKEGNITETPYPNLDRINREFPYPYDDCTKVTEIQYKDTPDLSLEGRENTSGYIRIISDRVLSDEEINTQNAPPLFSCSTGDSPSWDQYFLSVAHIVKLRSKDAQTKVGAVLVNKHNHLVATGYNSFPAGIDDSNLPTTRPDKYKYVLHGEENAICNLVTTERDLKLFCTAFPCNRCAKMLWNRGVRHWVIDPSTKIAMLNDDDKAVTDLLVKNGLIIEELECEYELIKKV